MGRPAARAPLLGISRCPPAWRLKLPERCGRGSRPAASLIRSCARSAMARKVHIRPASGPPIGATRSPSAHSSAATSRSSSVVDKSNVAARRSSTSAASDPGGTRRALSGTVNRRIRGASRETRIYNGAGVRCDAHRQAAHHGSCRCSAKVIERPVVRCRHWHCGQRQRTGGELSVPRKDLSDLAERSAADRAVDARPARPRDRGAHLKERVCKLLIEHSACIGEHRPDMPLVTEWR